MRRRAIAVLGVLALSTAAAGCGVSGPSEAGAERGPQAAARPGTGHDAFYDYPDQALVAKAAPGEILRSQPIPAPASSLLGSAVSRAERIMYRTADQHGKPVAATGFLLLPKKAPRNEDGWPLISWAHGTTGLGPMCAPSRTESLGGMTPLLVKWLQEGFAVVAADYPGLGPEGQVHGFLHLRAEGLSVAHAALAARNAGGRAVSEKWFAVGLSQGGHAALGAGEQAAEAKGMRFLGTAAFAPSSHLSTALRDAMDKQMNGGSLEGLRGLLAYIGAGAHVFDPETFPYDALLSPEVAKEMARPAVHNLCMDQIDAYLSLFAPEETAGTLKPDWYKNSPALREWLDSLNPAQRTSAGPVLVLQGEDDKVVPPEGTRKLVGELCAKENAVDSKTYPGVDHVGVMLAGLRDLGTWMRGRLENTRPSSVCPAGSLPTQGK
ncbi:alpha/beta hydrolase family protein [Streptomyces albogriseolus]|uniref:Alpha-beta hydrolase superfamily lysophospholipase n=2 Tax=Streptomyces albogriseolus TaxID=1887 RepID=A0ACC6UJX1_STRAO